MVDGEGKGPAALPKLLTVIGANVKTDLTAASVLNLAAAVFRTARPVPQRRWPRVGVGPRAGPSVVAPRQQRPARRSPT